MNYEIHTQAELDALPPNLTPTDTVTLRGKGLELRRQAGQATVRAYGSSTVTAYGSSTVTACDSSTVRACDSSTVTACGSSTVRAYGAAVVTKESRRARTRKASPWAQVVTRKRAKVRTVADWVACNGAEARGRFLTLYKRVSAKWETQEGTPNATCWVPGATPEHPAWDPKGSECGAGKFHACAHPWQCEEFRQTPGDRYVAIRVAKADCYVWPNAGYPSKIAFRKGAVLHECDANGKELKA